MESQLSEGKFGFRFFLQRREALLLGINCGTVKSLARDFKVVRIYFKANAGGDARIACGQGRRSNSEKRIKQDSFRASTVEPDALLHKGRGEGGGMRSLILS